MNKLPFIVITLFMLASCGGKNNGSSTTEKNEVETQDFASLPEMLVDSLLHFRHHHLRTDILSRHLPDITREKASDIQLGMLEKELAAGKRQIGWKMGGTVTADSASYDPLFGYMLDANVIAEDSVVSSKNFPGGQVAVEGEIGFVMKEDFKNGVKSLDELKAGIDYVVNAVEFAQSIAIPINENPETMNMNHVLASGMGQAGIIIGSGKASIEEFDMENETVKCFINDQPAAKGIATNVYGTPLNALHSLANMLPKHGTYLKKGDIVITGSLYQNPTIDNTCQVRLEFSSLGTIGFSME